MYLLIRRQHQIIFWDYEVPLPFSHLFPSELAAKKWMLSRGLQSLCKIVSLSQFKTLGGIL